MGEISMTNIIETQDLTYSYQPEEAEEQIPVLKGLNLAIKPGTFVAVLGHNGSGKSTLAKQFNGILLPTGGKVYVDGRDTADDRLLIEIRRRVGMVFQNPDNQLVSNIVEEDVAFAPENLGYPSEEIRLRVDEALRVVGMYEYRTHAPHLLSGGQKQRIAIAGVLAMAPQCVVFDEPTAMLDPKGRADVMAIIEQMRQDGTTVVLITHHMDETVRADRLVVISEGVIVRDGTPQEIFRDVEGMRALGLDVPETTDLLYELNREGCSLNLGALTVEECAEELFRAFA